jgi:hypothetical protein
VVSAAISVALLGSALLMPKRVSEPPTEVTDE